MANADGPCDAGWSTGQGAPTIARSIRQIFAQCSAAIPRIVQAPHEERPRTAEDPEFVPLPDCSSDSRVAALRPTTKERHVSGEPEQTNGRTFGSVR